VRWHLLSVQNASRTLVGASALVLLSLVGIAIITETLHGHFSLI
jgi:hypothetical protein